MRGRSRGHAARRRSSLRASGRRRGKRASFGCRPWRPGRRRSAWPSVPVGPFRPDTHPQAPGEACGEAIGRRGRIAKFVNATFVTSDIRHREQGADSLERAFNLRTRIAVSRSAFTESCEILGCGEIFLRRVATGDHARSGTPLLSVPSPALGVAGGLNDEVNDAALLAGR